MSRSQDLLTAWESHGPPALDHDRAEISIVWPAPDPLELVRAAIAGVVDRTPFDLAPAFRGAMGQGEGGRFWILAFPGLVAHGTETLAFEVARNLVRELELSSARPVLVDSLVGVSLRPGELSGGNGRHGPPGPAPVPVGWAAAALGVLDAWAASKGRGVTIAVIGGLPEQDRLEDRPDAQKPGPEEAVLRPAATWTWAAGLANRDGTGAPPAETEGVEDLMEAAPEAAILPIPALGPVVDVRQSRIPEAIERALAREADVIALEVAAAFPIEPVEYALRVAAATGVVTICPAGEGGGGVMFPARFAAHGLVTAVGAVDAFHQPWAATARGVEVVISAFGEGGGAARPRRSSPPTPAPRPRQGVSLAAVLTTAIAAVWIGALGSARLRAWARASGSTVQKMFNDLIAKTAYRPPSGWRSGMGAGVIDAAALLREPLPPLTPWLSGLVSPAPAFTSLRRHLEAALGDTEMLAGAEASSLEEDDAAEALWRLSRTHARRRADALAGRSLDANPSAVEAEMSAQLRAKLAVRPRLAAWID